MAATHATKRSVSLALLDGTGRIAVGNVTIPVGQPIPAVGSILDVKYLYARSGGSLYQPVYVGVREDIDPSACRLDQLKLRAGEGEEETEGVAKVGV